jgi:hypothetical protein
VKVSKLPLEPVPDGLCQDPNLHSRFYAALLKELDVDPQVRAEQMGHTVDVNENVYTRSSLKSRREAVNRLETALRVN